MARIMMPSVPEPAAEVILRHQNTAPVKVGAIARDLGLIVVVSDLPLAVSGMLVKDKNRDGQWTVRVNRHEHRNRQRYTIAHEIAHFVLHKDSIGEQVVDDTFYRSGLSERREFEANALAAEILMPWPLIRQLMNEGRNTAEDLANTLEVSLAAMNIRLGLPT